MTIYNQHVSLGRETTYGVAVTPSRSYDARNDEWAIEPSRINVDGFYRGRQAMRADRDRLVVLGATGSIETTVYDRGMGYLLRDLLGTTSGPTERSAANQSGVYDLEIISDAVGPTGSYTIQIARNLAGTTTIQPATYAGCVPVGWQLACSVEDDLRLTVEFDAESETLTTAEATPAYTGLSVPYIWEDIEIEVDGSDLPETMSFNFDAQLGLKTDRRFLQGTATKSRPIRSQQPEYTGTIECEYNARSHTLYQTFLRDETVSVTLTATSSAGQIAATGVTPSFRLHLPVCKFTGDTPTMNLEDLSQISLPFMALHDGTNPVATLTVVSEDDAF